MSVYFEKCWVMFSIDYVRWNKGGLNCFYVLVLTIQKTGGAKREEETQDYTLNSTFIRST